MPASSLESARPDTRLQPEKGQAEDRRWWILGVLAIAQLMIVVDASIVNIALPHAANALHISAADRQWVITAYTLTFGGLLLLGGRIADFMGRKRVLIFGLLGFAAASAIGGLAPDSAMLFAARALQGTFAALMAPAALSLLTVTFTEARERARAFGVWGAIAGGGLAIGLLAGGILTQYASWRWTLLVNVPIALLAAVATLGLIPESRQQGHTRYDIPGALTSTLGMVSLVYGVTKASTDGWGSASTLVFLGIAAVLLTAFVLIERVSTHALLPLRVVTERNRGGSYLTTLLIGTGLFGAFLFLTFYLQGTLHYSALKTGLAYLPFSVGIIAGAAIASRLVLRLPPRIVMSAGLLLALGGMLIFSQIGVHSTYWALIFPAEIVMSFGMGLVFVPVSNTALTGVSHSDAGVASALINSTQQVGGSIGTALLNTVATTVAASYIRSHGSGAATIATGTVHGYAIAFGVAAGFLALALIAVATLVNTRSSAGQEESARGTEVDPAEGDEQAASTFASI
jgi:EmrB/QacA subfamily drug resistance transporter